MNTHDETLLSVLKPLKNELEYQCMGDWCDKVEAEDDLNPDDFSEEEKLQKGNPRLFVHVERVRTLIDNLEKNNMKTAEQVATEFKTDLGELLKKYNAEVRLSENNDNCFTTVDGIEFVIPTVWDNDNNIVSDFAIVNIGPWANSKNL
jgi:hypothetical protein